MLNRVHTGAELGRHMILMEDWWLSNIYKKGGGSKWENMHKITQSCIMKSEMDWEASKDLSGE